MSSTVNEFLAKQLGEQEDLTRIQAEMLSVKDAALSAAERTIAAQAGTIDATQARVVALEKIIEAQTRELRAQADTIAAKEAMLPALERAVGLLTRLVDTQAETIGLRNASGAAS